MTEKAFEIGSRYRDRGSAKREGDQFLYWLKGPLDTGIKNVGGIRPLSGTQGGEPACIVLVSNDEGISQHHDPWKDQIDIPAGRIAYWGDAKVTNPYDESVLNQTVKRAFDRVARGERDRVPPVLMFRKPEPGSVIFCGLCIPDHVELREYHGENAKSIPNYKFLFHILDVETVPTAWIHDRAKSGDDSAAPEEWRDWVQDGTAACWSESQAIPEDSPEEFYNRRYILEREEIRVSPEFRAATLERYKHRCIATGIEHHSLLDLAHILPRSEYPEYASHPENVFVLNPLHHRAFDADLFTLDGDFRVHVQPRFSPEHPLLQETLVEADGEQIEVPPEAPLSAQFLERRNKQLSWW